jgi:REP element-mobilizing transposase RayT
MARKVKTQADKHNQLLLEDAILKYQDAIQEENQNSRVVTSVYQEIIKLYPAMNFVGQWSKRYLYLYDTQEDFVGDYFRIFCTSLVSWQPKHLRKKSRYGGTGDFKNYFWSSLQHNYINMVKAEASGKRNLSIRCPICENNCSTLSTHLMQNHTHLLWEHLEGLGINLQETDKCPFCTSYKISKRNKELLDVDGCANKLKKHILSMHSNYLFDEFKEKFPEYSTMSTKPVSVYSMNEHENDGEIDFYDKVAYSPGVDELLATNLSDVQKTIINKIFNGNIKTLSVNYDRYLYNCNEQQFESELEDLKDKLMICGIYE